MPDTFDLEAMLANILDDKPPQAVLPDEAAIIKTEAPRPIIVGPGAMEEAAARANIPPPGTGAVLADMVAEGMVEVEALDGLATGLDEIVDQEAPVTVAQCATPDTGYDLPEVPQVTFSSDEIAKEIDMRNFASLTTLNTRRWHGKVKDRKASRDVASANDADERAFEIRKNLLAGADSDLKKINRAIDNARAKYYEMTLPWTTTGVDDTGRRAGARILPNTSFFDFITEMGKCKAEMTKALDDFVPKYPQLIEESKKQLGKRFDAAEYPNTDSIRSHFDLTFDFQPIPEGKDFKGLPDAQCEALSNALARKQEKMVENAMQELWGRAHEAVGRMVERLSHPDKMFHGTLVTNVQSVARQLKHLNITGDKRIETLRQYIETNLCNMSAEDLRGKPAARTITAGHAQSVLDMMSKMGA